MKHARCPSPQGRADEMIGQSRAISPFVHKADVLKANPDVCFRR